MSKKRPFQIKWERILGLGIIAVVIVFIGRQALYVTSQEAYIGASIQNLFSAINGELVMSSLEPGQSFAQEEKLFLVKNARIGKLAIFSDYHNLQHQMDIIQMDVERNDIYIDQYEKEWERNNYLNQLGGVSDQQVENLRHKLSALRSENKNKLEQLHHLRKSIKDVREQLDLNHQSAVFMPFDGVIWNVFKKQGDVVKEGDIVMQVINARKMWVDAFFSEKDASYVFPGQTTQVFSGEKKLIGEGKIVFVRQGEFFKEGMDMFYDSLSRPQKEGDSPFILARITLKSEQAFTAQEFYGYGKKVTVRIHKKNSRFYILSKRVKHYLEKIKENLLRKFKNA